MDEPIVVDQEIVKAARAALDAGEVLEGAPGEDELERALASLYDTAQLGG